MSPEVNYRGIPVGMFIETAEADEEQRGLEEIVTYGMGFSRGKVMDATSVSLQVAGQRAVFVDYLSYVVFGRIVRLSSQCPEEKKEVCISVKFAQELGGVINQNMATDKKSPFFAYSHYQFRKDVDFTQEEGRAIIEKAFNLINVDALFTQLSEMEINQIRRMGSIVIPENPKLEQKPSDFILE